MQPQDDDRRSPARSVRTLLVLRACTHASLEHQVDPLEVGTQQPRDVASGFCLPSLLKRISFQKLVLMAVMRLAVYVFKVVEDAKSVKGYRESSDLSFMLISAACLAVPPLFYSVYLMGQHLTKEDEVDVRELGTKAVNGLLLMPWQIKRHLDVLHYAAQRVCVWRSPTKQETQELQTMKRNAEILEFFEDLYAGFLQIMLQVYLLLRVAEPDSKTPYFVTELVASCLSVSSMLVAVRRRDDGPLTGFLSLVGWSSLITSRVLAISLAATVLHRWIALLALLHVLAISIWVYNIAIQSFMAATPSVSEETTKWADTRKRSSTAIMVFLFFGIPSLVIWPIMFQLKEGRRPLIFMIVVTLENLLLLSVWFIHLSGSSFGLNTRETILVCATVCSTLAGVFFLSVYVFCKPKFTDQVVLFEIRESRAQEAPTLIKLNGPNSRSSNATQYGIYYEFCDLVFKLPSTHKIASDLEEIRGLTRATTPDDSHRQRVHSTVESLE